MRLAEARERGKIRGLAVVTAKRAPALPELPTIAEAGVPGYAASNWYGLATPAGTPKPILAKLHREIVNVLELADVKDAYAVQGFVPLTSTPGEFRAFIKAEIDKWGVLIKKIGLNPN